jgi:peroxin-3
LYVFCSLLIWPRRAANVITAAVTRSFTLIYTLTLLTIFTRVQLNLLGRRNYLSSVISLATPPANASTIRLEDHDDDDLTQTLGNDFETNRRYLAFSWWLLHRGWKDLMNEVQAAVTDVFGSLNPREDISVGTLSELSLEVRKKVEGSTSEDRRYVRPQFRHKIRLLTHQV